MNPTTRRQALALRGALQITSRLGARQRPDHDVG